MDSKSNEEIIRRSIKESIELLFLCGYKEYLKQYSYSKTQLKTVNDKYSGVFDFLQLKHQQKQYAGYFKEAIARENFDLGQAKITAIELYPLEPNNHIYFNARVITSTDSQLAELELSEISIIDERACSTGKISIIISDQTDEREPIDFLLEGSWSRFLEGRDYEYSVGCNNLYIDSQNHPQIHIYFRTIADEEGHPPCKEKQDNTVKLFQENTEYFFEKTTEILLKNFSKIIENYDDHFVYYSINRPRLNRELGERDNFNKDNLNLTLDDLVRIFGINSLRITNTSDNDLNQMVFYFYNAFDLMNDVEISFYGKEFQSLFYAPSGPIDTEA